MSTRDEGKTHFYGDDCPGGHRAANVAGVDWDDQETADEANAREAAERDSAALVPVDVTDEMVDAFLALQTARIDGIERVRAGLAAVVPLIRAQVAAEQSRWPFDGQVAEALRRLDGSTASGVALLTGMSRDEIEQVGGVTPAEEEPTDVQAAFEVGEKGVTERPLSNREFIAAEVERLGLQPKVDAMWAEIENGPPMSPGWCTWHQMVDCAGAAPECREARGEIDGRVEYGAAHGTCEHWGSWPTSESLIAWLADHPGWRPMIRVTSGAGLALPLPPFDGTEEREHPGTGRPSEGVPMAADGVERTYDLGYLSLPAEIQAEAERAVSDDTAQPLLVPTGPPRDPHAATVPFEAFVGDHPDHIDWVRDTGRCMASGPHECVSAAPTAEGQERSEERKRG